VTNGAPATAPRLVGVSRQLLLVSPARVALGLAALAAALVAGIEPSVAHALFGLGAGGLAFVLFTDPRPRLRRLAGGPGPPGPPPSDAVYASARAGLASALVPSTVGVAALAFVALAFDARLTAFLGGAVAGMGVASFLSGLRLGARERAEGVLLYADRRGRLFQR